MIPKFIIMHHSLTEDGRSVSWDAIRRYHMETKGWSDIGYHFGVERAGDHYEVFLGRMWNEPGAHCREEQMNFRSIGICCVGNYDIKEPPEQAFKLSARLVRSLLYLLNIPVENIRGHRDYAPYKTCPGTMWDMEKFRNLVDKGVQ